MPKAPSGAKRLKRCTERSVIATTTPNLPSEVIGLANRFLNLKNTTLEFQMGSVSHGSKIFESSSEKEEFLENRTLRVPKVWECYNVDFF